MDERDAIRPTTPDANPVPAGPLDRRGRDGAAGAGDLLGGLGAGAGDRLGPDSAPERDAAENQNQNQHSFADVEAATDGARNYHGRGEREAGR
jgi:hypothetical protein